MRRSVNEYDENRGGGYQIPRTRAKSNDQEALDYLGAGFGAAGAAAGADQAGRPH